MSYEAFAWRPDVSHPPLAEALARPDIARYLEGWGRAGDLGVVAEPGLGAAWIRLFTEDDHGYGFVAPDVPELTIAVSPRSRGRGVGTALLTDLVERARAAGHPAMSLSVELDNHAAVRLYEQHGFVRVESVGNAWTMQRILG